MVNVVLASLKITAVPKLISFPLTVPTIAVPLFELSLSLNAIMTLPELVSKSADMCSAAPASKVTSDPPKDIEVPLTVPTFALPLLESFMSRHKATTLLFALSNTLVQS